MPLFWESPRSKLFNALKATKKSVGRKGKWAAFQQVFQEYLDLGHAEPVSSASLFNPPN